MNITIHDVRIFLTQCCRRKASLDLTLGLPENKERNKMQITITNEQKIKVTLNPVSATGKPAPLDGVPDWEIQSGDSFIEPSPDGLSAYLISSDIPGLTSVLVSADADLGEGVEEIQALIELNVIGAKASSLGLTVGEPEAK